MSRQSDNTDFFRYKAERRILRKLYIVTAILSFEIGLSLFYAKYDLALVLGVLLTLFFLLVKFELEDNNIFID